MGPIIRAQGVGKKFRIGAAPEGYSTIRESLIKAARKPFERVKGNATDANLDFWALRDISFDIFPGDVVGIVGRNGAGKSTLLKVLSRITEPTTGRVELYGRIGSLLEVGTGFHPELTGRENIYMNGSILGMRRSQIDTHFDEIVDFSGVERFLDTPLKRFSSGMQLRLAFAVAAHLDPEILVIDEVLAVGDAEFQKKCLNKMNDVSRSGRTVLFVSHNTQALIALCSKGILLRDGLSVCEGDIQTVLAEYLGNDKNAETVWERGNAGEADIYFESVSVELRGEQPKLELVVESSLRVNRKFNDAFIAVDILDSGGSYLMQAVPRALPFISYSAGRPTLTTITKIELPPLIPGRYQISCWIGSHFTETIDWVREVAAFEIATSPSPERTFQHSPDRGFCVPVSTVEIK
ncbi:MAG: polysaccharide ABC transporter ATP-binding protein [Acidobacteriota bacterium]